MKITLFKHVDINVYCKLSDRKSTAWVRLDLDLSLRNFMCFIVAVPNSSFCSRNPFRALLSALEHQTRAAEKWDSIKEKMYKSVDNGLRITQYLKSSTAAAAAELTPREEAGLAAILSFIGEGSDELLIRRIWERSLRAMQMFKDPK